MTEAEWLTTTDPVALLLHVGDVRPRPSARKLRLVACGCCRAVWDESWPTSCRYAVEAAEQFADGRLTDKHLHEARAKALQAAQTASRRLHRARTRRRPSETAVVGRSTFAAAAASNDLHFSSPSDYHLLYHADLVASPADGLRAVLPGVLRDVLGNPFRPAGFDPKWRTETAVALAAGVYADRAFDRLPILADALEDAGCDDAAILTHCRGDGPHVRGCWVLDLLLRREQP